MSPCSSTRLICSRILSFFAIWSDSQSSKVSAQSPPCSRKLAAALRRGEVLAQLLRSPTRPRAAAAWTAARRRFRAWQDPHSAVAAERGAWSARWPDARAAVSGVRIGCELFWTALSGLTAPSLHADAQQRGSRHAGLEVSCICLSGRRQDRRPHLAACWPNPAITRCTSAMWTRRPPSAWSRRTASRNLRRLGARRRRRASALDAPPRRCTSRDAVISSLPYYCNPVVAKARAQGQRPLLRSDRGRAKSRRAVRASRAGADQRLRAPMWTRARASSASRPTSSIKHFDELRAIKLRVGALPQHPNNVLKYSLTWSTEGLINEYGNPCQAVVDGRIGRSRAARRPRGDRDRRHAVRGVQHLGRPGLARRNLRHARASR